MNLPTQFAVAAVDRYRNDHAHLCSQCLDHPEQSASMRVRNRLVEHGFLAGVFFYVFLWMGATRRKRFERGGW